MMPLWRKKTRVVIPLPPKSPDRTRKDLVCGPQFREVMAKLAPNEPEIDKAIQRIDRTNRDYIEALKDKSDRCVTLAGNRQLAAVDALWFLVKDLPEVKRIHVPSPKPLDAIPPNIRGRSRKLVEVTEEDEDDDYDS